MGIIEDSIYSKAIHDHIIALINFIENCGHETATLTGITMRRNKHFIKLISMIWVPILLISVCGGCIRSEVVTKPPTDTEEKSVIDEQDASLEENSSNGLYIQDNGSHYLISLPKKIVDQVDSCSLSIVGHGDNGYLLLIYDRDETILEDGTILVSKDQPVLTMLQPDTEERILIPDVKESDENGCLRWTPDWLQYAPSKNALEGGLLNVCVFEKEDNCVELTYKTDAKSLEGWNPLAGTVGLDYWNSVKVIYKYIENIKDTYGNTEKIDLNTSLERSTGAYSVTYPLENVVHDIRFQMTSVVELKGTFYGQINVKLKNRDVITSNLFLLNENGELVFPKAPEEERDTAEVQIENGIIYFDLYEDHAVLTSYKGSDDIVQIPDYVVSKPVTEIGINAFANTNIRHVVFPDTLIKIDSYAFQGANFLESIDFPENLEYIGAEAFGGVGTIHGLEEQPVIRSVSIGNKVKWIGDGAFCALRIKEFVVEDENLYYISANGVLYTRDMSCLLEYPIEKEGDFTVPEGVRDISFEAFRNVGTFSNTNYMNSLILSNTVEHLYAQNLPRNLQYLYIGSGLKEWEYIPNRNDVDRVEISKDNKSFLLEYGAIYDKDKTRLLKYWGSDTRFTIPDTVLTIVSNAFSTDKVLEELRIPASLTVSGESVERELSSLSNQLSNLSALRKITVENGNPFFNSVDGVLYANEGKVLVSYPAKKPDSSYKIFEGTEIICGKAFVSNKNILSLEVPASLIAFQMSDEYNNCLENSTVTNVSIDDGNLIFYLEPPFIIDKTDNSIYHYFSHTLDSTVTIPNGISEISSNVFTECYVSTYYFPEGVELIDRKNFCSISDEDQWDIVDVYLPETLTSISSESFVNSPAVVLHAPIGSYAEKFAHENNISFQSVR